MMIEMKERSLKHLAKTFSLDLSVVKQKRGLIAFALISALLAPSIASAERRTQGNNKEEKFKVGVDIPLTPNPHKRVVRDRVEMRTGELADKYKETQYKAMERDRVLNEVFDPFILMTPVRRVLRPIDTIGISPAYITQIVLPDGYEITDFVASFNTVLFEANQNILRVRPDARTFYVGNIVLSLTDGTKNYTMTIFAERYYSSECREDQELNSYICRRKKSVGLTNDSKYAYTYNNLSTLYQYTKPQPLSGMEVIALFERMHGRSLHIQNNLDSVSLSYEGISYTITRDDRYGSFEGGIMYRGVGYRVVAHSGKE